MNNNKNKANKAWTKRSVHIFSRHSTHDYLRENKIFLPKLTVLRLGSTTNGALNYSVEINSVESIKNSANKLLMKQLFQTNNVKTADWFTANDTTSLQDKAEEYSNNWERYIVAKHVYGSRGTGNTLIKNEDELSSWMQGKDLSKYIFERFYNMSREYRLHVTKDGCFYTCRKVIKSDTPQDKRWYRNDSNSSWLVEENPKFDKPVNWNNIVEECVKALKAVKLDIGAIDVKVQSAKTENGTPRTECDFIILETNSAPSFGDRTAKEYAKVLPKIYNSKINV